MQWQDGLLVLLLLCGAVAPACDCVLIEKLEEEHKQAASDLKDDWYPRCWSILQIKPARQN